MDIDTERLKTDAAYWDDLEVPRGATHYDKDSGFFCCITGYWTHSHTFKFLQHGHNQWGSGRYIPRPQAPEAEWADGLPPSGIQCECYHADLNGEKQWIECDVVGPYGDYVICAPNGGGFYGFDADELRPIRTPEQRQRDELVDLVATASGIRARDGRGAIALDIADAILSRYNLEPKE